MLGADTSLLHISSKYDKSFLRYHGKTFSTTIESIITSHEQNLLLIRIWKKKFYILFRRGAIARKFYIRSNNNKSQLY